MHILSGEDQVALVGKGLLPLFGVIILSVWAPETAAQSVDYQFAPSYWRTLISFPADSYKTLVDEAGALNYDFGPGPYAQPGTQIRIGVAGDSLQRVSQRLADPRAPVVITEHEAEGVRLRQEAFAVVLDSARIPPPPPDTFRIHRQNGRTRTIAWADPNREADPAFQNVAWGSNRPIRYQIDVAPGSCKRIAMGFCDSYRKPGRVKRVMRLQVEGADPTTLDVVATSGQNEPHVVFFDAVDADEDGQIQVEVAASTETEDPNVFVNGIWMFAPDTPVTADVVISDAARSKAEMYLDAGREPERQQLPPRVDAIRARFEGQAVTPVVHVETKRALSFDPASGTLGADGRPFVATHPKAESARETEDGWVLAFPREAWEIDLIVIRGHRRPPDLAEGPDVAAARDRAINYWNNLDLPWDRIQVPDPGIQALLEASIRTIYQLREVVDDVPQFQPGSTVYRGLWAANHPRVGRALTMLGDPAAARQSLEQLLRHQRADGQIAVLTPPTLLKETGSTVKALSHQARLTNEKEWLEEQWPHVERAVEWIQAMREEATRDPYAPNYGLMPAAPSDGGVGGIVPEYTTVYWSLMGLRAAIDAAQWLGKTEQAFTWEAEFADFWAAFRRAVARDMCQDEHGNWFLPIRMNYDPAQHVPQRSQVSICHMIYPGRLFDEDSRLVEGTLGLLRDADSAQGLPVSIGWLDDAVWAEVGFTCAQAYLWNGDTQRAQELLYAAANHAAPTMVWAEEQMPGGSAERIGGDVPHGNASAEIINVTRYLIAMERDEDTLDLLRGVPASWIQPGAELSVNGINTTFGPLTLTLTIFDDGQRGTLTVAPVGTPDAEGGPVVHLRALKAAGYVAADGSPLPDRWGGSWGEPIRIEFRQKEQ